MKAISLRPYRVYTANGAGEVTQYQYLLNSILFFFWAFLFMTFFRVFTFMGYGRCLRGSLFLGGLAYFFMPDFSPGKIDVTVFIGIPLLIIILRAYLHWKKKEKSRETYFLNK